MSVRLTESHYGKARVRLVAVERGAERHELADWTVDIRFGGDYERAHREGDNAGVYPTDSMKNSVYALARDHAAEGPERFALRLACHFLTRPARPAAVEIAIEARPWRRIEVGGAPHPHAFVAGSEERRLTRVAADGEQESIESGVRDLVVLKTTGSAFAGFPRDEYTTLAETGDRILATAIEAVWRYDRAPRDFDAAHERARRGLLETFAGHESRSVQHTLYAMGERVLEELPEAGEIRLRLPNRHHWRADLAPFGRDNPNLVFVATAEPYGLIEGTLSRA